LFLLSTLLSQLILGSTTLSSTSFSNAVGMMMVENTSFQHALAQSVATTAFIAEGVGEGGDTCPDTGEFEGGANVSLTST
jgi:hypothetical protein